MEYIQLKTDKTETLGLTRIVKMLGTLYGKKFMTFIGKADEIDIGRKLDKGNEFLKNLPDMKDMLRNLPDMKDMLGSFIVEQRDYNRGQQEHNTRLEAILEKLVDKS